MEPLPSTSNAMQRSYPILERARHADQDGSIRFESGLGCKL